MRMQVFAIGLLWLLAAVSVSGQRKTPPETRNAAALAGRAFDTILVHAISCLWEDNVNRLTKVLRARTRVRARCCSSRNRIEVRVINCSRSAK